MLESYHFIGIGGIGMSALARILLSKNIAVSGSDIAENYITDNLVKEGAAFKQGHSASHILSNMKVVYSSGIQSDNAEYQAAVKLNCPLLHRSDLLQLLSQDYRSLAVSGTHGKTTTSSLLATVLFEAGLDPSFCIGGILNQFESNSRAGKSDLFAFEADESDGTFLKYSPYGAIVTNIDNDHIEHFNGDMTLLIEAFRQFMGQVQSSDHLFWCGDDSKLIELNMGGYSYGFGSQCQCRSSQFKQNGFISEFDIDFNGRHYSKVELALIGRHNALNALGVFGLCINLGIDEESIRNAFSSFGGVLRRCQKKGQIHGVTFIDDYAHHPTEIAATLTAMRQAVNEQRLIAVFQPHRYSRTKGCFGLFGSVFDRADEVIITDIYASGESPIEGVSAQAIVDEVKQAGALSCRYVPKDDLVEYLAEMARPHDVVLTLGAGDIHKVGNDVIKQLSLQSPKKLKVGLIYGGRSSEHDISLLSAANIAKSLNDEIYDTVGFGITKKGNWITGDKIAEHLQGCEKGPVFSTEVMEQLLACDVLLPILHGPYGEDGTIQGFFDMLGKAYVGCNHSSAAICMNKAQTKKLVSQAGLNTAASIDFTEYEWGVHSETIRENISEKLHCPLFIKPVHLGSSIGISKVKELSELNRLIKHAFHYDDCLLVENGISNCREIEFAVLGNDSVQVFPPGEVLTGGCTYDYEAKYGSSGFGTTPCADLPEHVVKEGMLLAEKAYKAVGCSGLARVDFFLDEKQRFWFNEINPMPGFTSISLYPQICAHNGLEIEALLDRLIVLAMHRKRKEKG